MHPMWSNEVRAYLFERWLSSPRNPAVPDALKAQLREHMAELAKIPGVLERVRATDEADDATKQQLEDESLDEPDPACPE